MVSAQTPQTVHRGSTYQGLQPVLPFEQDPSLGYPELAPIDRSNYPETAPSTAPEYLSPSPEKLAATEGYSEQKEAVAGPASKICGIPRKLFWIGLALGVLILVGLVVGLAVGLTRSKNSAAESSEKSGADVTIRTNTALAVAYSSVDPSKSTRLYYQTEKGYIRERRLEDWKTWTDNNTDLFEARDGTSIDAVMWDSNISVFYFNSTNHVCERVWNATTETWHDGQLNELALQANADSAISAVAWDQEALNAPASQHVQRVGGTVELYAYFTLPNGSNTEVQYTRDNNTWAITPEHWLYSECSDGGGWSTLADGASNYMTIAFQYTNLSMHGFTYDSGWSYNSALASANHKLPQGTALRQVGNSTLSYTLYLNSDCELMVFDVIDGVYSDSATKVSTNTSLAQRRGLATAQFGNVIHAYTQAESGELVDWKFYGSEWTPTMMNVTFSDGS